MRIDEFSAPLHIDGVFDDTERIRFASFGFDLAQPRQLDSFGVSMVVQNVRLEKPNVTRNARMERPSITQNVRLERPNIVGK